MKKERFSFIKVFIVLTLAAFLITVVVYGISPLECENEVYGNVLRLHVLANSDEEYDQALKLRVRDAIVAECDSLFADCKSIDEAQSVLSENIALLSFTAKKTMLQNGYFYPVQIVTGRENYPEKKYDGFTFPAGEYISLRVKLGEARGKNWWCVLFPPLCVESATGTPNAKLRSCGFSEDAVTELTSPAPHVKVRFKVLEIWRELTAKK